MDREIKKNQLKASVGGVSLQGCNVAKACATARDGREVAQAGAEGDADADRGHEAAEGVGIEEGVR